MMPRLKEVKVSLKVPYFGDVEGTWVPDEEERRAAWEMYVELVTRAPLGAGDLGDGLLREVLDSLHSLFGTTRAILRGYGPALARPQQGSQFSFGTLAIIILNGVLRPILSSWHPALADHESQRAPDVSPLQHERGWQDYEQLKASLDGARLVLAEYGRILGVVAGVPSLIIEDIDSI